MTWARAAFCAAFFLALAGGSPASSQDITLRSPDGAVEISGMLLGFDGEFYRVDTKFGELTVDGSGVICDGPACPNIDTYVAEVLFSGASSMTEVLLPALVEGFARRQQMEARRIQLDETHFLYELVREGVERPAARFEFHVTTTDEGFADLLANEADVVLASREIRPEERQRAMESGIGDLTEPNRSRVLALDALVPVVTLTHPLREISTTDLARLLSGEITNWALLGGPDAPVTLHLPAAGSGLSQAAEDRLLRPLGAQPDADGPGADIRRHSRSGDVARAVGDDPFGIGFTGFAEIAPARALTLTGSCGFSLSATRRTIKTEDYPLTAPLFLYLPARRLPRMARDFLAYTRSDPAQIVIRRSGFVDQAPEEIPINDQGDRFANALLAAGPEIALPELRAMTQALAPLARLTTSFRFEPGSARLDAQSRSNVAQLAGAIATGTYDTRRLLFAGFSDGQGPAADNLRIAEARAGAVRDAVLAAVEPGLADRVDIGVAAFGEALPMACDDSDWGRGVNRRVEIWVR
ncbi:phosphate ABC transporter substrate-binding/OmpA family protein [Marinibacterium sp. SX1]|uniref:phosphate ABC transporter substrate-binding/OmpA family protein n=1 Tax=Marinibacterium sp. SX1 TaxID=3388424 RepID=UPI003D164DD8